ncbi:MAG TPA: 3-deoxy-D-manno-octulosonic acid kinase, partial [Burkholderiales bacterium]|nr:3-deoxy-D-manno-octulosonic acid kinase [Burkholderiales bacterium]
MNETVENTGTGAIVYDRAVINQISAASFRPDGWRKARPVVGSLGAAGRGSNVIVSDDGSEYVLRHYRRGGLPGRVNRDLYLWLGEQRTRAFREWRLLARLYDMGLPVPRPAAAHYRRSGLFYTNDLLTVREPGIRPLSDVLIEKQDEQFWRTIGSGIRCFHAAGVFHADLNAYNVQIDRHGNLFLLDFDRGRMLPYGGGWQQRTLARLCRSLSKIRRIEPR